MGDSRRINITAERKYLLIVLFLKTDNFIETKLRNIL